MSFWIRDANLTLGNKKYTLSGLNFAFEIPFEDSDEPPVATVTITNLSENTRASIKKNDPVVLNAGYEGDVGCILIGKVTGLKHKQSGTDWTSTVTVLPCADEILGKMVSKTYAENIKASAIVRDLLNIFGVEVARCELTVDKSYPRGRVCRGNLKQVLTEIVVNECKSRFIIRTTGQIYITKATDGINGGVLLTTATGLLRSDEEKVPIPVETKLNSQKTGKDRNEDLISRSCLLNYRIATAELVRIQSEDLNGKFVVVKGKHKGDRTGDWKTTLEVKAQSTQSVVAKTAVKSTAKAALRAKARTVGFSIYSVGDVVNFVGSRYYRSSAGDRASSCKPGTAKVTQIAEAAKHPYHLIYQNGGGSTVYGWVNTSDISGMA